jgi:hypothetical protein
MVASKPADNLGAFRMGRVLFAATAALLSACAPPHQIRDRSDFLAEATREYRGETPERVITAAQTVLRVSDPTDFEFRNSLNGFVGLRRYVIYAVIAAANGREKWEFNTEQPAPGMVRAAVSVEDAGQATGGYTRERYEGAIASVPLFRLFWDRVDYVLGRRADWKTCDAAAAELQATNTNVGAALGGLCGATSDGRNAPPPPQLAPVVVAMPDAAKDASRRRHPHS